ncbi:MAG TPA: 3-oxoadipate enol-lactonase [Pseudonocardiaceae bacterium]|nr:3-oxoadipate enol-lactonase [Pseudonocardiaceae bacterium]
MGSVEVHYELTGSADSPVLVLAGPVGGTLEIWDPLVERLAERFRVLRYDHRGHGRSPSPPGPYDIADLAGDALALLDRLGIERAAFCGLSLGGMVGIWLAARAPKRVSSLVLCSASARYNDYGPWIEQEASVRWMGTSGLAEQVVEGWFSPEWAAAHPEAVERARHMVSKTSDEGYSACCGAISAWDGRRLAGRINTPTLVIGGSRDLSTPVTPHAKMLAATIYQAKLEIFDGAHLAVIEDPERAVRLIFRLAAPRR